RRSEAHPPPTGRILPGAGVGSGTERGAENVDGGGGQTVGWGWVVGEDPLDEKFLEGPDEAEGEQVGVDGAVADAVGDVVLDQTGETADRPLPGDGQAVTGPPYLDVHDVCPSRVLGDEGNVCLYACLDAVG